jgi:hypothetical protein
MVMAELVVCPVSNCGAESWPWAIMDPERKMDTTCSNFFIVKGMVGKIDKWLNKNTGITRLNKDQIFPKIPYGNQKLFFFP